ncbi:DnaA regulatory inactivator Hda [Denitratisoma sp. agr-D3]
MSSPNYRQLLLDIHRPQTPTLDNFVAGGNQELMQHLHGLAAVDCTETLYLWGPQGCGKSHLLRAVATAAAEKRPVYITQAATVGERLDVPPDTLLIVDDLEQLSAEAQVALFRAFIAARPDRLALLLSGTTPPLTLALAKEREDLRTRVGQCLIYEIKPLSDEEKAAALQQHASGKGMKLEDAIVQYLLRHGRRDLPSLLATVDALDRASLELKRPATLPLLREIMADARTAP